MIKISKYFTKYDMWKYVHHVLNVWSNPNVLRGYGALPCQ